MPCDDDHIHPSIRLHPFPRVKHEVIDDHYILYLYLCLCPFLFLRWYHPDWQTIRQLRCSHPLRSTLATIMYGCEDLIDKYLPTPRQYLGRQCSSHHRGFDCCFHISFEVLRGLSKQPPDHDFFQGLVRRKHCTNIE